MNSRRASEGRVDDLVIVGAGGHGRETLDIVEAINSVNERFRFCGYLDDRRPDSDVFLRRGVPYLGPPSPNAVDQKLFVIGIGSGPARRRIDGLLHDAAKAAVLIHPKATVASDNRLAQGVLVAVGRELPPTSLSAGIPTSTSTRWCRMTA